MTDDPYVYPGTSILRNRLDLRHQVDLDAAERQLTRLRAAEGIPTGDFDLTHLQSIHRHLLQDVYAWAGEVRTVEIAKGGHQFMFRQFIGSGMADVYRRIAVGGYFVGLSLDAFAAAAGTILGDVNYIHPFREGNGRTQLQYLKQLCERAGHRLDLRCIDGDAWHAASRSAHTADKHFHEQLVTRQPAVPLTTTPSGEALLLPTDERGYSCRACPNPATE